MRTLPKVLKYLPSDKAQDARNYVNSLQYWLGGNDGERAGLPLLAGMYVRTSGGGGGPSAWVRASAETGQVCGTSVGPR